MKLRAAALLLLALLLAPAPAAADQGSLCMPTSGVISGLTFAQDVNAAFQALVTSNAGSGAPANPCSGTPEQGQWWLDAGQTPPVVRYYDGTAWESIGSIDTATGTWLPPVGGGAASVASAGAADIWGVPQNYVTITGTTTITALSGAGDSVLGTLKVVKFAGVLTLTHNATSLILPNGGSNITTAAGDYALVASLGGGNVAVAYYQRANGRPLALPNFTGDSGAGGVAGAVPAPTSGSTALGKVLSAGGDFTGNTVPVGASMPYAGLTAPGGWLLEYGQAVSRSTYSDLWTVLHSSATITVTIASPAVVTWTAHPLSIGSPVSLATTVALPTGLSAATTYYVISAGYGANSFEVSASVGGAAVNTSGTQSGVQTATYAPYGPGDYSTTFNLPDMRGRIVAGLDNMGGSSANRLTAPSTFGSMDGDVLGNAGGEEAHSPVIAEMPSHFFSIQLQGSHGTNGGGSPPYWSNGDTPGSTYTANTNTLGSYTPFNVVQPTQIMNYIIRY